VKSLKKAVMPAQTGIRNLMLKPALVTMSNKASKPEAALPPATANGQSGFIQLGDEGAKPKRIRYKPISR
jgi:hypothetical protein